MLRKLADLPVVVIDTNVLVSYLFGGATIASVIESVGKDAYIPAISPYLEREFMDTIRKPRIANRVDISEAEAFMEEWRNFALYVKPRYIVTVCRDRDDNEVLACALESDADWIVSGDSDLLVLKAFEGIPIVTPAGFLRLISR